MEGKRSIDRSIHHVVLHYPIRQQFCYDGSRGCNRSGGREEGGSGSERRKEKQDGGGVRGGIFLFPFLFFND